MLYLIWPGFLDLALIAGLVLGGIALGFAMFRIKLKEEQRKEAVDRLIAWLRHRSDGDLILTQTNGNILFISDSLVLSGGASDGSIQTFLSGSFGASNDLVYRLHQNAARAGFSGELLTAIGDRPVRHYLTCQRLPENLLLWSLLDAEEARVVLRDAGVQPLGAAPFPAISLIDKGVELSNLCFRQRFGRDHRSILERIDISPAKPQQKLLVDQSDGTTNVYSAHLIHKPRDDHTHIVFLEDTSEERAGGNPSSAMDQLPIGLMQFDLTGRLLWMNRHGKHMVDPGTAPGMHVNEIFTPLGRSISSLIEEATATGSSGRGAMMRLSSATSIAQADSFREITLTRTEIDGTDSLLAVVNDANELRKLEDRFAQSQKMEAIGKLAGGVAHDFNNVLTAIRGHCDFVLMNREETDPDYDDLLQIKQNSNRAANMVRHLLAFSRQQTLQPILLNVRDVVSDAHLFLNSVIGEKVTLKIEHDRELWPVMADQHQLEQVLMNLVVNARDAMMYGGEVTLVTRNKVQVQETMMNGVAVSPGDFVEISVIDSGTGIPDEVLNRMFDPFFTTKAQGQGTGLGLSTVYGIVKQSGGYIFAENREGGGACLRVILPAVRDETPALPTEMPSEIRRDLTGKAKVLLVEDEDSIRSVGSRALKQRGYEVFAAASAEDAMEMLVDNEFKVDVLVSDVVMPGMDGPSFAVKAKGLRPELRLIFMSGYAEDSFRNSEIGNGFLFLPKTF